MRQRATRMSSNAHGPLKTVAAFVAAMFAATTAPAFDWSANDLSTQYQDSGGTLPVTAVEQPVGLVLDRSKGSVVRGVDLVQNGSFTSGLTGWTTPSTAPGSVVVTGGVVKLDTGTAGGIARLRQAGWTTVPGAVYEMVFQITDYVGVASNNLMQMGTTAGGADLMSFSIPGNGTFRLLFRANTNASHLSFYVANDLGVQKSFTLDNVSCRQIAGTNLWQGTPVTKNANWTDNGDGSFTSDGNNGFLGWPTTPPKLVVGRTYECVARITSRTGGQLTLPYDGAGANNTNVVATVGTFRRIFTATTTALYIYSTGFAGTVDSIYIAEIPGNHLIQPTSASRPTLTARVNRLSATEALDNATYWAKSGSGVVTVTPNVFAAPDGTMTGDEVAQDGAGTSQAIYQTFPDAVVAGVPLKFRVSFRAGTVTSTTLSIFNITSATHVVDSAVIVSGPGAISGTTFRNLTGLTTGAWTTVELTCNAPVAGNAHRCIIYPNGTGGGTTGASVGVWGAHAEQSTSLSRYQRVNTPTDYDTVGFAKGWRFDGVDDGMYSPANLDLTSTNKLSITMAVLATSSSGTQILMETGASYGVGTGRFEVSFNEVFAGAYTFARRAPTPNNTYQTELAAAAVPRRNIYSALSNGDSTVGISTRVDGVPSTRGISNPDTTPAHSSDVIYFGRRNNASNPFQGVIYSARLIGRRVSPDELGWLEALGKLDMNNNL